MIMAASSSDQICCRICLERDENESKLLRACNCTGSQELVHYHCLKAWIESSNSKKCSVCKTVYSGLILQEKSATVGQWISNTPGLVINIVAHTTVIIFFWYFLLVAFVTSHMAEKSDIFIILKLILTILNCMFTGMLIMYHMMAITALVCSYRQFARENRTVKVRGYIKNTKTSSKSQSHAADDVEQGKRTLQAGEHNTSNPVLNQESIMCESSESSTG